MEFVVILIAIIVLCGIAFYAGVLYGNKKCNDWWNQYGAQIYGEDIKDTTK